MSKDVILMVGMVLVRLLICIMSFWYIAILCVVGWFVDMLLGIMLKNTILLVAMMLVTRLMIGMLLFGILVVDTLFVCIFRLYVVGCTELVLPCMLIAA